LAKFAQGPSFEGPRRCLPLHTITALLGHLRFNSDIARRPLCATNGKWLCLAIPLRRRTKITELRHEGADV